MYDYRDFIKNSSQGALINGTVITTNALLIGSASMAMAGILTLACGYGVVLYLDYLDTVARCKEATIEELQEELSKWS